MFALPPTAETIALEIRTVGGRWQAPHRQGQRRNITHRCAPRLCPGQGLNERQDQPGWPKLQQPGGPQVLKAAPHTKPPLSARLGHRCFIANTSLNCRQITISPSIVLAENFLLRARSLGLHVKPFAGHGVTPLPREAAGPTLSRIADYAQKKTILIHINNSSKCEGPEAVIHTIHREEPNAYTQASPTQHRGFSTSVPLN